MDNLTAHLTGMLEKARAATRGPWNAVREQNALTPAGELALEGSPSKTWGYRCGVNTAWIHGQSKAALGITFTAIPAASDLFADMTPHADIRWEDAQHIAACSPEIIAALVEVALAARQVDVAEGAECDTLFQKLDALGKAVEG